MTEKYISLSSARERVSALGPRKPSQRWISKEARRLGCYRKVGREVFILAEAWDHFVKGEQWGPSTLLGANIGRAKVGRKSSTRGSGSRKGEKTASYGIASLNDALALCRG